MADIQEWAGGSGAAGIPTSMYVYIQYSSTNTGVYGFEDLMSNGRDPAAKGVSSPSFHVFCALEQLQVCGMTLTSDLPVELRLISCAKRGGLHPVLMRLNSSSLSQWHVRQNQLSGCTCRPRSWSQKKNMFHPKAGINGRCDINYDCSRKTRLKIFQCSFLKRRPISGWDVNRLYFTQNWTGKFATLNQLTVTLGFCSPPETSLKL